MKTIYQYPKPTIHGPECGDFNGAKIFEYLDCTDGQRYFCAAVLAPDKLYCDVDSSEIILDPGIIYRPK